VAPSAETGSEKPPGPSTRTIRGVIGDPGAAVSVIEHVAFDGAWNSKSVSDAGPSGAGDSPGQDVRGFTFSLRS
jgi:hypothetical protein